MLFSRGIDFYRKKLETLMAMLVCRLSGICCVEKTVTSEANSTVSSDVDGNLTVQLLGCRLDEEITKRLAQLCVLLQRQD